MVVVVLNVVALELVISIASIDVAFQGQHCRFDEFYSGLEPLISILSINVAFERIYVPMCRYM